jgi:hypothetical protein
MKSNEQKQKDFSTVVYPKNTLFAALPDAARHCYHDAVF